MKISPLLASIVCLLFADALRGQMPAATPTPAPNSAVAITSNSRIIPGKEFSLSFLVAAPAAPLPPATPKVEGLVLGDLQPQDSSRAPAGVFIFSCTAKAKREGNIVVPAMTFRSRGTAITSPPLTITVRWPELSDQMELSVDVSKKQCYAGEPVVISCRWASRIAFAAIRDASFDFPIFGNDAFRVLSPDDSGKGDAQNVIGLPVEATRIYADLGKMQRDGKTYQTASFQRTIVPTGRGSITIPAANLVCAAPRSTLTFRDANYPAYFDNSLFDQNLSGEDFRYVYCQSKPITLEIEPLPGSAPALFNGLVGTYAISATAGPASVQAGESVTLSLKITSKDNPDAVLCPNLEDELDLVKEFEVSKDQPHPERLGDVWTFERTIRPRHAGVTEIPPISLVFFRPQTKTYETVSTAAIPLRVIDAVQTNVYVSTKAIARKATNNYGFFNTDYLAAWLRAEGPSFWRIGVLLAGLLIFSGIIMVGWRSPTVRERGRQLQRWSYRWVPSAGYGRFHRGLRPDFPKESAAALYRALYPLLRRYFSERMDLSAKGFDARVLRRVVHEAAITEAQKSEIVRAYEDCLSYAFTRDCDSTVEAEKRIETLRQALKALDGRV